MAHAQRTSVPDRSSPIDEASRHEREGDPRAALVILQPLLEQIERGQMDASPAIRVLLIASDCAFKMSDYATGTRHIERLESLARPAADPRGLALALVHRARISYQQGRYSDGLAEAERALTLARDGNDFVVAARARMCQDYIAMGQGDYPAAARYIAESVAYAEKSGDKFIESWVLNSAGLHYYYLALAKVLPNHLRGHPSSAEPQDFARARDEIIQSVHYFTRASRLAVRCGARHHAGMIESNYLRVCIMLGDGDKTLTPLRRQLRQCQDQGLKNNELALRHTYAWALRTCGHHAEAERQIEAALLLARRLGRVNRIVELLHYDRSLVRAAMGDAAGALASYHRYQRSHTRAESAGRLTASASPAVPLAPAIQPPLEPFYMKRADHFLAVHAHAAFELDSLARHCGVSPRSLQLGFKKFRGVSPMTYARNLRLDAVHRELQAGTQSVATVAQRFGFQSVTTFSTEYRRRFGVPPRVTVAQGRRHQADRATTEAATLSSLST